jgi:hypothetical protein
VPAVNPQTKALGGISMNDVNVYCTRCYALKLALLYHLNVLGRIHPRDGGLSRFPPVIEKIRPIIAQNGAVVKPSHVKKVIFTIVEVDLASRPVVV